MKVEILDKKRIFDSFFKIEETLLRHEKYDGSMTPPQTRFSFERGESVAVVLFDPAKEEVLLIEQFRYPAFSVGNGGWLLEIVAGSVDSAEGLKAIASKEVLEETGYFVPPHSLEKLCEFFASPGGSSERVHLYSGLVSGFDKKDKGGGKESEGEDIRLEKISLSAALDMVQTGKIEDAKTIIALLMLEKKLAGKYENKKSR